MIIYGTATDGERYLEGSWTERGESGYPHSYTEPNGIVHGLKGKRPGLYLLVAWNMYSDVSGNTFPS